MLPYPLRQLRAACTTGPLRSKVLLVPQRRCGHSLTSALARHGVSWTHLRVMTVVDLAYEKVQVDMALAGARRLEDDDLWLLMTQVLDAQRTSATRCYGTCSVSTPVALQRTLTDLRLAGVTVEQLAAAAGERTTALAELLAQYEKGLAAGHWWDGAQILVEATQRVAGQPQSQAEHLLILDETELPERALAFVQASAGDHIQRIGRVDYGVETPDRWAHKSLSGAPLAGPPATPVAQVKTVSTSGSADVVQGDLFLDHLLAPDEPEPTVAITADIEVEPGGRLLTSGLTAADSKYIRLWQATGHEVEIRAILRELLDRGLPFDEVEIAYPTTHNVYLPLLYDAVCRFDLPAAFVAGVPLRFTSVGRCLGAFFHWIQQDLDGRVLIAALRAGEIPWPRGQAHPSVAQVTGWLVQGRVGSGRSAFVEALDRAAAMQPDGATASQAQQQQVARDHLEALLSHVPEAAGVDLADLARSTLSLVEELRPWLIDETGVDAICRRLARLATGVSAPAPLPVQAQRLGQRLLTSTAMAQIAGPGQISIAPLAAAGYAGRTHVYVIGLAESHFPAAPITDPALSEQERIKWSMTRPQQRGQADTAHLIRLLGVSPVVTLSAHRLALADGREPYPTPLFAQAQRQLAVDPVWQRPTSGGAIGCDDLERALSLRRRSGYTDAMALQYPATVRGYRVARARGHGVTRYDGWIGADTWSMQHRFSARMLETLAECPRRFLWRDGLGLHVPDEPVIDPRRWLQPMEMGNLLHDLFAEFMRQLQSRRQIPDRSHEPLLAELLEAAVHRAQEQIPNRLQAAYRNDRRKLEAAAQVFLVSEIARFAQIDGLEVMDLERDFGAGEDGPRIQIGGREMTLRGRIDRIDRIRREGDESYEIWDYKTGSTYSFEVNDLLAGGRRLQWALYALVLPQILGQPVRVETSGYFFTSERGAGQRFAATPPTQPELTDVLDPLLRMAEDGLFPALHKAGAGSPCRFCDYRRICADEAGDGKGLPAQREVMAQWTGLVEGWAQTKAAGRQQASQVIESRLLEAGVHIEDIGPLDTIDRLVAWMSS